MENIEIKFEYDHGDKVYMEAYTLTELQEAVIDKIKPLPDSIFRFKNKWVAEYDSVNIYDFFKQEFKINNAKAFNDKISEFPLFKGYIWPTVSLTDESENEHMFDVLYSGGDNLFIHGYYKYKAVITSSNSIGSNRSVRSDERDVSFIVVIKHLDRWASPSMVADCLDQILKQHRWNLDDINVITNEVDFLRKYNQKDAPRSENEKLKFALVYCDFDDDYLDRITSKDGIKEEEKYWGARILVAENILDAANIVGSLVSEITVDDCYTCE